MTPKMTSTEKKAVVSLSSIMSLRMIGLFMVLPMFALYAAGLQGQTPLLIGTAVGIYGLTQALFQIPFGVLSDHFGRKPLILIGLVIFILGSVIAGMAESIYLLILGRALQGVGAVGSTILALMADLTREQQRSKSMAIAGMSIGFSFSVAMLIGPLLTQLMPVNNLFFLAALFGGAAICILYFSVPTPVRETWHSDTEPELHSFFTLLFSPELAKLNVGIFILHILFTANFVVLPIHLFQISGLQVNQQWILYVPSLLGACALALTGISFAERKQQIKTYFLGGIVLIGASEILFWLAISPKMALAGLCLFFTGFSLLEAFLPSLVSRTAPASRKGSALGIYSCAQFSGIFVGGVIGGWLYGQFSFVGVYLSCLLLSLFWLTLAAFMQSPRYKRQKES